MKKINCKKDEKGFGFVKVFIRLDKKQKEFNTLVRTGSEYTIFNAKELGVDITKLQDKKITTDIGMDSIDIYPVNIEYFSIGDEDTTLYSIHEIYVSELDYFKKTPLLGMDILRFMELSFGTETTIEFDDEEIDRMIVGTKRKEYLETSNNPSIEVNLDHFYYVKDGILPEEFESCILISNDKEVMIGNWETGLCAMEVDSRGAWHGQFGHYWGPDDILAWKGITEAKLNVE